MRCTLWQLPFGILLALAIHCAATQGLPASPPGVTPESITVTSRSFSSHLPACDAGASSPSTM